MIIKNSIRDTQRVRKDNNSELNKLFLSVKKSLGCSYRVELRIGTLNGCSAQAYNDGRSRIVFLDEDYIELLDEEGLLFLIGHEMGHIILNEEIRSSRKSVKTDEEKPAPDRPHDSPMALRILISEFYSETMSDAYGVAACGNADTPVKLTDWDFPDMKFAERYQKDDFERPSSDFGSTYFTELKLKGLKLFLQSEWFIDDIVGMPLFHYREKILDYSESADRNEELLAPIMNYSHEDNSALAEFTGAAIYVANPSRARTVAEMKFDDTYLTFGAFSEGNYTLASYSSVHDALRKIDALKSKVQEINHQLKYDAFSLIAKASFGDDEDPEQAEAFLHDIGNDMGIEFFEIRESVEKSHHCY